MRATDWNTVLEHVIDVFERSTLELWNKSPTEDNGDNGDGTVCEGDDIDEVRSFIPKKVSKSSRSSLLTDKSNLSTKVSVLCL